MMAMHPPTLVRGNASEVIALSGGRPGRGTDSLDATRDALPGAQALLAQGVEVVAISGAQDLVVSREGITVIAHGHPWLTRVSGAGCALGGIMAACAGAEGVTAQQAAVAATLVVTLAAEQAVDASTGIGGFVAAWLDALSHVSQSAHVPEALKAWQEEP